MGVGRDGDRPEYRPVKGSEGCGTPGVDYAQRSEGTGYKSVGGGASLSQRLRSHGVIILARICRLQAT